RRTSLSASDSANWVENSSLEIRWSLAACQGDTSGPPPSASTTVSVARPNRRASATDAATASVANASQCVVDQLQPRSGPGRADPNGALTQRVEEATDARADLVGPRREDRQLALLRRLLASRHWRVEERHIRTLGVHHRCDALDTCYTDRA